MKRKWNAINGKEKKNNWFTLELVGFMLYMEVSKQSCRH